MIHYIQPFRPKRNVVRQSVIRAGHVLVVVVVLFYSREHMLVRGVLMTCCCGPLYKIHCNRAANNMED